MLISLVFNKSNLIINYKQLYAGCVSAFFFFLDIISYEGEIVFIQIYCVFYAWIIH